MHYRNGREAKNGDKIIQLSLEGGRIMSVGILHDATTEWKVNVSPSLEHGR